jgi:predicted TIM-barrel enzyme
LRKARERAQRDLVISVATLALSGVAADAHVGDEDVGQAIEDELSEFDATEVYLVTAETGPEADQAVLRLADRVVPPLRPIHVSSPGDRNGVD